MTREKWQDDALCAQIGTEMFFPEKGGSTKTAMSVCDSCPVRRQCLDYALSMENNPQGIWGGTSFRERRAMRRDAA